MDPQKDPHKLPGRSDAPRRDAPRAPVGRLAPSPTGPLHVGHARSFLLAWWQMRALGGRIVLRLDDLDGARSDPRWCDAALRDLAWLGLDWDGAPWRQSAGLPELEAAVEALVQAQRVYPCVCTRREVAEAASAPHGPDESPYAGTCRGRYRSRSEAHRVTGRDAAWRFRVRPGETRFNDRLLGPQAIDVARSVGDFPVTRRDGTIAYQLAVVVDDARQGVTDVLRGADLLDSTPRQVLLAEALGLSSPRWTHVPLVVDESGQRLAKRDGGLTLAELRARGVDPRALVAWIARSAGLACDARATPADLVTSFELERMPKEPVRFGPAEITALERG